MNDWTMRNEFLALIGVVGGALLGLPNPASVALGGLFGGLFTLLIAHSARRAPEYGPHQ